MSSSYTKLFVHFVWATRLREPLIAPALAPRIHGYLSSRARELNCIPLAVGGVADHVHALLWMSPEVGVSQVARELKAPTTRFIHRVLHLSEFAWQEGYGSFTLRESEVETVGSTSIDRLHTTPKAQSSKSGSALSQHFQSPDGLSFRKPRRGACFR